MKSTLAALSRQREALDGLQSQRVVTQPTAAPRTPRS